MQFSPSYCCEAFAATELQLSLHSANTIVDLRSLLRPQRLNEAYQESIIEVGKDREGASGQSPGKLSVMREGASIKHLSTHDGEVKLGPFYAWLVGGPEDGSNPGN
jgi:hypothetical protein